MKIGYFNTGFPYKNPITGKMIAPYMGGGIENVIFNLAVEMAKRGHEVSIFTSSIDSTNSVKDYGKIKIYRYKQNFKVGQSPISFSLLYKPVFSDIKLDIIHAHIGNLPAPLTAYFYAKKRNKPLITTYHEDAVGGFGSFFRRFGVYLFDTFIVDKLLSESDIVLTPSEYYIEKSKHLKKINEKVKTIPNGINLNEFTIQMSKEDCRIKLGIPNDKKVIIFMGSLTPRKAPHILINSMKKVLKEAPNSYLVLVGYGNFIEELKTLSNSLGISPNVIFTGFVNEDTKLLYYNASDVFVLPSFSEGFGIVLLEASAFGLPLIVSDLEVFNTIVKNGYNGLFTKTGDGNDLAEKIIYLLQNEDLRTTMGENAKQKVKGFSWEMVADKTERIYLELAKMESEL